MNSPEMLCPYGKIRMEVPLLDAYISFLPYYHFFPLFVPTSSLFGFSSCYDSTSFLNDFIIFFSNHMTPFTDSQYASSLYCTLSTLLTSLACSCSCFATTEIFPCKLTSVGLNQ